MANVRNLCAAFNALMGKANDPLSQAWATPLFQLLLLAGANSPNRSWPLRASISLVAFDQLRLISWPHVIGALQRDERLSLDQVA